MRDIVDIEPGIHELTDAEAWAVFDNAARHYVHMSGEEFLRAWRERRFDDCNDLGVAWVTTLIRLSEPS